MYNNDEMTEKMSLVARKIKKQFKLITYVINLNYYVLNDNDDEVTEFSSFLKKNNVMKNKLSIVYDKFDHHHNNEFATNPWRMISNNFLLNIARWPITFILWCTIPDCRRFNKYYILTFINCVIWILFLSYLIASLITVVGKIISLDNCFKKEKKKYILKY